jgi:hypothetical protein
MLLTECSASAARSNLRFARKALLHNVPDMSMCKIRFRNLGRREVSMNLGATSCRMRRLVVFPVFNVSVTGSGTTASCSTGRVSKAPVAIGSSKGMWGHHSAPPSRRIDVSVNRPTILVHVRND